MFYIFPSFLMVWIGASGLAAEPEGDFTMPFRSDAQAAITRGLKYLETAQASDGGWQVFGHSHPAITALVVQCFLQDPGYGRQHPAPDRGLAYILRYVQPDGGIYVPDDGMNNYHTSVVLMALSAAKDPAHRDTIRNAQKYLKKIQWDSGEGHEASSPWYGGAGYGEHKRPDLSNTQFMLEALKQSGLPVDDPVYKTTLVFVQRCQMLGTTNDQAFAMESDDGGFVYSPANGGESKAGVEVVHGKPRLRSYGTMTYSGFKSMLYANVDRNDARVQRAFDWIQRNYTLDYNPNMPEEQTQEGVYYYYYVFAKALQAWGEPVIRDGKGVPHRWREELCAKVISLQRADGRWVNDAERWWQGNPALPTAFSILALQTALEP